MIKYLDYNTVPEFNTIEEVAHMFNMSKEKLRAACECYRLEPMKNSQGIWGFDRWQTCHLHNKIYREESKSKDDKGAWD